MRTLTAALATNAIITLAIGALLLLWAADAWAHSLYPLYCCNGTEDHGDCRPVPCETISENDDGSYTWQGIKFAPSMALPSFDKNCHVCVNTLTDLGGHTEHHPHCIFIQESS